MRDSLLDYWEFVLSDDGTWRYCQVDGGIRCPSEIFSDFGSALAHATTEGFNPASEYWMVKSLGRTTHFRPGRNPINMPSGKEPED
jgi:hypothetical protein